jgi:A118 family predicted phage portal protein
MLNMQQIADAINKLGIKTYSFDYGVYSKYIDLWYSWYRGRCSSFHTYQEYNGVKTNTREKEKLYMAKTVCEDHASLTVNDNLSVKIDDTPESEFILGHDEMTGILGQNDFWSQLEMFYELTCALGTGAYEVVVEDIELVNNFVNKAGKIKLVHHNAMEILPISWDTNGRISEIAFVDQFKIKDKEFIDLRIHVLEDGEYVIINKRAEVFNNTISYISFNDNTVEKFYTHSNIPWFSVLKLPVINNFDIKSPMGVSVYGNAISVLENVDEAFNSLCVEFRHSSKKVYYHKSLLQKDTKTGQVIFPEVLNKTDFYFVGNENMPSEGELPIKEQNPDIRIDAITSGLQSSLNYLSVKCGLGSNFYKFTEGSVVKTATEVISENSDTYRNIKHYQVAVQKFLIDLIKSVLYVSNVINGTSYNVDTNIHVIFDASIIEDKNSIRTQDLKEVELGIMSIDEYREKWYGVNRRDTLNE